MKQILSFLLLGLGLALAHAEYVTSSPKAKATLKTLPSSISIIFSEAIEVRLSIFKVYALNGPKGADSHQLEGLAQDKVSALLNRKNDAALRADTGVKTSARTSKIVSLCLKSGLKPGSYVVMWNNLSTDGHTKSDFFVFSYAP
ncbi:MAG: copper resistance protein CopC [Thermaceae bacterium]|nr:copper resistance protein CopC [Thermaceae bacterium]